MTLIISRNKFEEFKNYLENDGFELEPRQNQEFLARKKGVAVNLYSNGKITFGGTNRAGIARVRNFINGLEADASGTAYISSEGGNLVIKAPYREAFVSELKANLKSRRWHPAQKAWVVETAEKEKALGVVRKYFQVNDENVAKNQDSDIPNQKEPVGPDFDISTVLKPGASVEIWTDGGCVKNPGPGGYGIVYKCRGHRWEKAGGFSLTTNNRMEIIAALVALEALPDGCSAIITSDSRYLVDSITKGWAADWQAHRWMKSDKTRAENTDLWERMLKLCAAQNVVFKWVRGHASNAENKRCDQLAEYTARKEGLPADSGYKQKPARKKLL